MKKLIVTKTYVYILSALFFLFFVGCGNSPQTPPAQNSQKEKTVMQEMNTIAESYIKLAFQLGKHDSDYVDAYFGPEALKKEAEASPKTLQEIISLAEKTLADLNALSVKGDDKMAKKRHRNLQCLLSSLKARAEFLNGKKMTFDEESQALYNAVSPTFPEGHFDEILKELDQLVPGKGDLQQRINDFSKQFTVPADKTEAVYNAAIAEARKRTKEHIKLPENEKFILEYVKDKPWGAYNWFKGNATSLIQMNTDFPLLIDRPVGLACHEGYPGHHVYYSIFESKFFKGLGWVEFSIYPLYSPASLIAEGTANFGIEVAFPNEEQLEFVKEVLFPIAGLDAKNADLYFKILKLRVKLGYGGNDTSRLYLDGKISKEEAVQRFMKYQLRTRERSEKYLSFIDRYRSYVINYNVGYKMVKDYIESKGGTPDKPEKLWEEYIKLISTPILPEDLVLQPKDETK